MAAPDFSPAVAETETRLGSVLWIDRTGGGAERCTVVRHPGGFRVVGLVLREHDKAPLEVRYRLEADGSYRVGAVRVTADTAAGPLDLSMRADGVSHWHQQGMRLPWLDGCRDVYFDFSPAPLVLTVSRLALRVGERAEARVACVRYPFLDAEAAVFGFERLDEERTSVSGPKVSTVLHLDERGMLVDYEGGWSEIARA